MQDPRLSVMPNFGSGAFQVAREVIMAASNVPAKDAI